MTNELTMKKYLSLITLVVINISCNSKPKTPKKEQTEFTVAAPISHGKDKIGFACNYGGNSTDIVREFSSYLKEKNYKQIKSLLFSSKPGEKYLATISSRKLAEEGLIELNDMLLKQIKLNEQSIDTVSTCSGCTNSEDFTLTDLLNSKDNYIAQEAEWWLEEVLKNEESQ